MSAHTPGPWKIRGPYFDGSEGYTIAVIATMPSDQANACLIAAAPELLAALEVAYSILMSGRADSQVDYYTLEARVRARAAIAKAKGEQ